MPSYADIDLAFIEYTALCIIQDMNLALLEYRNGSFLSRLALAVYLGLASSCGHCKTSSARPLSTKKATLLLPSPLDPSRFALAIRLEVFAAHGLVPPVAIQALVAPLRGFLARIVKLALRFAFKLLFGLLIPWIFFGLLLRQGRHDELAGLWVEFAKSLRPSGASTK